MSGDGELGIGGSFARWRGMKSSSSTWSRLTPAQRGQIIQRVIIDGWTNGETAAAFGIAERMVSARVAEYRRYGMASLHDRPAKTAAAEVVRLHLLRPLRGIFRGIASGLRWLAGCENAVIPSTLPRSREDRGGS
jgi:hypothetical protein